MTKKKSPDFEPLPFEIDEQVDDSLLTPHAGVPLAIELFRAGGAARAVDDHVLVKHRGRVERLADGGKFVGAGAGRR